MPTISVQHMPNGFEVETPSFLYWLKAGVAFTLGAGGVYVFGVILWLLLLSVAPSLGVLRMFRLL